jgi:hypothetical protein
LKQLQTRKVSPTNQQSFSNLADVQLISSRLMLPIWTRFSPLIFNMIYWLAVLPELFIGDGKKQFSLVQRLPANPAAYSKTLP